MHQITQQQMDNLQLLQTIIQKKIDNNENPKILNHILQPCGTKGCILGDYLIYKEGGPIKVTRSGCPISLELNEKAQELLGDSLHQIDEFGHEMQFYIDEEYLDIFGTEDEGSLGERLTRINYLIATSKVKSNG